MMQPKPIVAVLGIFVVDLTFRSERLPEMGETLLGAGFAMGPGGKGSNQAVAVARAGGQARLISAIGRDNFGEQGLQLWAKDGIETRFVMQQDGLPTGAACIMVSSQSGDNAIIVEPGAARAIDAGFIEQQAQALEGAAVFMTQLETALAAGQRGLELARAQQVKTILNPAPAAALRREIYQLCDFITPNETEAAALTGIAINSLDEARAAGQRLLELGVGTALITLGAQGVLLHNKETSLHVPGFKVEVVETTGAGDAFNGAFAVALAEGRELVAAARFGCAAAALSVTKPGAAASLHNRSEIEAFLRQAR